MLHVHLVQLIENKICVLLTWLDVVARAWGHVHQGRVPRVLGARLESVALINIVLIRKLVQIRAVASS